jgi:hypothetical protein
MTKLQTKEVLRDIERERRQWADLINLIERLAEDIRVHLGWCEEHQRYEPNGEPFDGFPGSTYQADLLAKAERVTKREA